jgi:hypothetical protein
MLLVEGAPGALFPHAYASQFLDEPKVVRMMAIPLFLAAAVGLSDYYFF